MKFERVEEFFKKITLLTVMVSDSDTPEISLLLTVLTLLTLLNTP
jgi:hypothetical protein